LSAWPGSGTSTKACRAASASIPGRRAADLLVTGEQERYRQRRFDPGSRQGADRRERDDVAALHVQDAWPVGAVALDPPGQGRQGADRMHGVEMPEHKDAGHITVPMGKACAHAIAEAHPSRDGLDRRPGDREVAGGQAHHAIDRGGIVGRALALDPGAQRRQDRVGVDKQVRGHRALSLKGSATLGQ
jgi:hypothetical protein